MNIGLYGAAVIVAVFLFWIKNSLYVIKEWERGVVLRLGKLMPHAKMGGVNFVFYPIDKLTRISLRLETMDVPPQDIITHDNGSVKVKLHTPQRAITPGQAAVFYQDDLVIGGGWISR